MRCCFCFVDVNCYVALRVCCASDALAAALIFLVLHPDCLNVLFWLQLRLFAMAPCTVSFHRVAQIRKHDFIEAKKELLFHLVPAQVAIVSRIYFNSNSGLQAARALRWLPGPCSQDGRNRRVQSTEPEGRSCHVSLFAHTPSSLQCSTLSPCTLLSPYSGTTRSTLPWHLDLTTTMMPPLPLPPSLLLLPPLLIILFSITHLLPWMTNPFHLLSPLPALSPLISHTCG